MYSSGRAASPRRHVGSGDNTFDIEFVTIGNPGNPADTTGYPNPGGSVDYMYKISKYEISRDMVTKAEGNLGITLDPMDFVTGGPRSDMPATGVSWNEWARFVNWLNTSQGHQAAYKFGTQPGDVGYTANSNILLWNVSDPGFNAANPFRNSLAHYFLPSVGEWYKAAYYDPNANDGAGGYWNFPTGSDTEPTPVASGTAAGTAVYLQSLRQGPADITLAGGLSPYGVMGLGGIVHEWVETNIDLTNDNSASMRGLRGGDWPNGSGLLAASYRYNSLPENEADDIGLHVASVAEFGPPGCVAAILDDLINDGSQLCSGDLMFSNFQCHTTGDVPPADRINVTPIEDEEGDYMLFKVPSWTYLRQLGQMPSSNMKSPLAKGT